MKTVVLLRHGDADDASTDFERALSTRGVKQCVAVASELTRVGFMPERVICSSARRAHQTATLVAERLGFRGAVEAARELYLANAGNYLTAVRKTPRTVSYVLFVAHNPSISELASRLAGGQLSLPPAGYELVTEDIDEWQRLGK